MLMAGMNQQKSNQFIQGNSRTMANSMNVSPIKNNNTMMLSNNSNTFG